MKIIIKIKNIIYIKYKKIIYINYYKFFNWKLNLILFILYIYYIYIYIFKLIYNKIWIKIIKLHQQNVNIKLKIQNWYDELEKNDNYIFELMKLLI